MTLTASMEAGGVTLQVRLPESTSEVLQYRSFISLHLDRVWEGEARQGLTRAVRWMISWLAAHCDKDEDWIDENLSQQETHIACLQLIAMASIPPDVAKELEEWAKMIGRGGCQCAICKDPDKVEGWTEKTLEIEREKCKWVKVSRPAEELIGCVHSLEGSNMLQAPWFLYHARERYEIGLAMGRREQQRKEEKRDKFLSTLEEAGVRRPRRR